MHTHIRVDDLDIMANGGHLLLHGGMLLLNMEPLEAHCNSNRITRLGRVCLGDSEKLTMPPAAEDSR